MNAAENRRWFVPRPSWLVFCLLASTGFLYLSQRYQWFEFNQHKGYTVLIAVACVGAIFLIALVWLAVALLFRLRFQSSLRSLLLLTLAAALPFSWLATEMRNARRQREVVAEMETWINDDPFTTHCFEYDWQTGLTSLPGPPVPRWLHDLLGVDFFSDVAHLQLSGAYATDANLERLEGMSRLQWLVINSVSANVTNAGMKHLAGLTELTLLQLSNTKITNAGLIHLRGLTHLVILQLNNTEVTDTGLNDLARLSQLHVLRLGGTKVTDAGLASLNKMTQLEVLYLNDTKITDAGLEHLKGLTKLEWLILVRTKVTDAGVADLKRNLPGCNAITEPMIMSFD